MKYNYLFSDMDGTLLDGSGNISEENKNAIRRFMENGGHFTVATGRSETIARPFLEKLDTNFPAILFNGAAVYDFGSGTFLYKTTLANEIVREIYEIALSVYPEICFQAFAEGPIRLFNRNGVTDHLAAQENQPMIHCDFDPSAECIKLLLYGENAQLKKVAAAIAHLSDGNFVPVFSAPFYLEILPVGCSKGTAMAWMIEHFQIPGESIAAIGDFDNDLAMIRQAALGAAPANAQECVKKAADIIVSDNNSSALADLITNHIL